MNSEMSHDVGTLGIQPREGGHRRLIARDCLSLTVGPLAGRVVSLFSRIYTRCVLEVVAIGRHSWCASVLSCFTLMCLAAAGAGSPAPTESLFTRPFDQRNTYIRLSPAQRWGMFRASDRISVRVTTGSPVRVFTRHGQTVYEGASGKLPRLPVGHYFVETDGDRAQFAVLPDDYVGASFLGTECDGGNNLSISAKLKLIKPVWMRETAEGFWNVVQPAPGVWHWEQLDHVVQ